MDELTRLLLSARDGNRSALLAAIRRSQAEVWRLAAHVVGRDDADDVTQDTFLRAWRALPSYRGDAAGRTWLLAIARRTCADALRSRARRRRLRARLEHEALPHPCRAADGSEPGGAHALDSLVEGLDAERRIAFVLTQVVGCSYAETAEICDVPVGTIRSRVARARAELVEHVHASETG
jgi:RNA polymerase sigma-70 factor (ECF subfamily)